MRTIIELFDSEPLNNIASHLFFPESRIIYIGSKSLMTKRRREALAKFFKDRSCMWTPEYIEVERFDLNGIIRVVEGLLTDGFGLAA